MTMAHFVGLDVSVKETAVCVVDEVGEVVLEQKVPTEPDDIVTLLTSIGEAYGRVGIEAGPLSQWLVNALATAGLPVVCVENRTASSRGDSSDSFRARSRIWARTSSGMRFQPRCGLGERSSKASGPPV
jgi:transposase